MDPSKRVKKGIDTEDTEQRPSSSHRHSNSHPKRLPKPVSRGSAPQDSPPISPHTPQTPQNGPAHTYARHRNSDSSSENFETKLENETEEEDVQEDALQALASYMAFQRTLLRHIEIDPSFAEFSDHSQDPNSVESTRLHPGHLPEDYMPSFDIGKGKRPELRF